MNFNDFQIKWKNAVFVNKNSELCDIAAHIYGIAAKLTINALNALRGYDCQNELKMTKKDSELFTKYREIFFKVLVENLADYSIESYTILKKKLIIRSKLKNLSMDFE